VRMTGPWQSLRLRIEVLYKQAHAEDRGQLNHWELT